MRTVVSHTTIKSILIKVLPFLRVILCTFPVFHVVAMGKTQSFIAMILS